MNAIVHLGTGKLRCRNQMDGKRCPYRADAHPPGGCPTRNARLARAVGRKQGDALLRLDAEAAEAGATMLEQLQRGVDLRQVVASPAFKRFAAVAIRAAQRMRDKRKAQGGR